MFDFKFTKEQFKTLYIKILHWCIYFSFSYNNTKFPPTDVMVSMVLQTLHLQHLSHIENQNVQDHVLKLQVNILMLYCKLQLTNHCSSKFLTIQKDFFSVITMILNKNNCRLSNTL